MKTLEPERGKGKQSYTGNEYVFILNEEPQRRKKKRKVKRNKVKVKKERNKSASPPAPRRDSEQS